MNRSREQPRGGDNNRRVDEVSIPRLHQQSESSQTSTPPKSHEKAKAMNIPISKITIGEWIFAAPNHNDIVAKVYFAKKQLLLEFLFPVESEPNTMRLKRKIEMQWDDVSSFKESTNLCDETGILEIELRKRPTFFIEIPPRPLKPTQWKKMDQDFTRNQASLHRRHTLQFYPGDLQKNLEKLLSFNFWSKLYQVRFPLREAIYFDNDYGSNNNTTNNTSRYIPSQTSPSFYVDSNLYHYPQGISYLRERMLTPFEANDGWQNSYSQPYALPQFRPYLTGEEERQLTEDMINEYISSNIEGDSNGEDN